MSSASIKLIECRDNEIVIYLTEPIQGIFNLKAYLPNTINPKLVFEKDIEVNGDSFTIARYYDNYDGCFFVFRHEDADARCVESIVSANIKDYPIYAKRISKKGLRCVNIEDGLKLGMRHTVIDLPVQTLLRTYQEEDCYPYEYQGKTYYIYSKVQEWLDDLVHQYTINKVHCTINLLICIPVDDRMKHIVEHPDCNPKTRMSAFNITSEAGYMYIAAICNFLAKRYTEPEVRCVDGLIIANEINVQRYWASAGEKTCQQYLFDYSRVLRVAWLAGAQYWKNWRVYISLENHFGKSLLYFTYNFTGLESYAGKECLEWLDRYSVTEGNFNWNVAFHPYAYDLRLPDFWNDDLAQNTYDSEIVSFKNLNVLVGFVKALSQWEGSSRKIILSEQGFNSSGNPSLEWVQAAAYGHAFKKVMCYPEIEAFIYHSHVDNKNEENGLKLGLRRSDDFNDDSNIKPIYHLMKVIETRVYDDKPLWYHF